MSDYYMMLTTLGKAKVSAAIASGTDIDLTNVAVGSAEYTPSEGQTGLVAEQYRAAADQVYRDDPENPNWVVVEFIVPADEGGYEINEVGVFDGDGDLFAIGKYPKTYKPTFEEGSGKELLIKAILEISNTANVTLVIDPNIVTASKSYVDARIAVHDADGDAHPDIWAGLAKLPGGAADSELTIASDAVAPFQTSHPIDTEGDDPLDYLRNIATTNLADGAWLLIRCVDAARVVIVVHEAGGAGQIHLAFGAEFRLDDLAKNILLQRRGADWWEVARGYGGDELAAFPVGYEFYTTSVDAAPAGSLYQDGAVLNISSYPALYSGHALSIGQRFGKGHPDEAASADAGTDEITITSSPVDGWEIRFTSTGTLPAPLAVDISYFIVNSSGSTFQVAASPGGAAIDITDAGSGTHTAVSWTFKTDDKRGLFRRVWDPAASVDVDAADRTDRGDGTTGNAVGTKQPHAFQEHFHKIELDESNQPGTGGRRMAGGGGIQLQSMTQGESSETRPVNVTEIACIRY